MAIVGMRYPRYCIVDVTQNENGIETETLKPGKAMGKAISADVSLNISQLYQYADDGPAEIVREFINGTIELQLNDLTHDVKSDIYGQNIDENGTIWSNTDDNAPYLRWGYIRSHMLNKKRIFEPVCFMRVTFSPGNISDQTKGENIELRGATVTGSVLRNSDGNWMAEATFDTKEEAVAWLNEKLNIEQIP